MDTGMWALVRAAPTCPLLQGQYHTLPMDDLRSHECNERCWCGPVEDLDPEIGPMRRSFVHNSLDGREAYETGMLRPS